MFKNLRKKKKGFTLIELIIVIAIIAILAAISVPSFGKIREGAKSKAELADAKNIANAVTMAIGEGDKKFDEDIEIEEVDDDLLGSYLESIPKTSAGGSFYIKVTNGNVVVYNEGKDEDGKLAGEEGTQVYPQVEEVVEDDNSN